MKNKIINFEIVNKYFPKLNSNSINFKNLKKYINHISLKYDLKKNKNYHFKKLGNIIFPYSNMGKIESYDLIFNPNEFIVFYLYQLLKKINKRKFAADFGANLGLHSIILDKLGYKVESYEPDPHTFKQLKISNIVSKYADGNLGWKEQIPFDRIIITAATPNISIEIESQIAEGGIIVSPMIKQNKQLIIKYKKVNNVLESQIFDDVLFVPNLSGIQ